MSFGFNGPGEKPIIQAAQNMMNNGGGGNLGYFQGRQKKKNDSKENLFSSSEEDSFTLSSDKEFFYDAEFNEQANNPLDSIKNFFKKITEKKPNDNV